MTLLAVRTQFVKRSGRYDLVTDATSFADNGADFFINAGQKFLDRLETHKKSFSTYYESITAGDWYSIFQNCRSIKEVWISNSSGEKWKLTKTDFDVLRAAYAEDPANLTQGDPLYYSPIYLRTSPETANEITIDQFGSTEYTVAADHYEYNGIVFMPPAQETYTLEVKGLFYHPALSLDADTNYWTEVQSIVLVMAAMRAVEVLYRNTEGVKDWENAIKAELFGLGLDMIEEDIAEVNEMEG